MYDTLDKAYSSVAPIYALRDGMKNSKEDKTHTADTNARTTVERKIRPARSQLLPSLWLELLSNRNVNIRPSMH